MADEIDWKSRAERAEKACAEMRDLLTSMRPCAGSRLTPVLMTAIINTLDSTDCGKDYVHVSEAYEAYVPLEWADPDSVASAPNGYIRREELDAAHEELFAHAKVAARVEADLKAEVAKLKEALNKVRGFGKGDMGYLQLCDYVTLVADEALGKEGE